MSSETEILSALFAAALGSAGKEDNWSGFLHRLAGATQAGSALMQFLTPGAPPHVWRTGSPWEGPREAVIERMRTGRVYSQIDLPGPNTFARPIRAVRWTVAQHGIVLLALQREGNDFRALDGAQLSNLTPYLGPALVGWQKLHRELAQAELDREVCRELGAGWIAFTHSGEVIEMASGLAERLEAVAGMSLRADGRLSFPDPGAAQALRQSITAATLEERLPQAVTLSRAPMVQIVISTELLAGNPAVIGRVRHGLSARSLPPDRVALCFGLNRSEAALAVRLCDGFSLKEAALDMGWTLETARSCSKMIFARMGVRGQPGVVRRILESAVWFV